MLPPSPHPAVDKLAAKLRDGPKADRPLVLLARARAADYRGEEVPVPQAEPSPTRLAAFMEASEHASAAARSDPSSPLLALHAVFACLTAIDNGASLEYTQAQSLHGEGDEATAVAFFPMCHLHIHVSSHLADIFTLTARIADGGGNAGGGNKKKNKKVQKCEAEAGGGKEVAAPSAGSSAGGGSAASASGGGSSGPPAPTDGAAAEPQPSDPLTEVRQGSQEGGRAPPSSLSRAASPPPFRASLVGACQGGGGRFYPGGIPTMGRISAHGPPCMRVVGAREGRRRGDGAA